VTNRRMFSLKLIVGGEKKKLQRERRRGREGEDRRLRYSDCCPAIGGGKKKEPTRLRREGGEKKRGKCPCVFHFPVKIPSKKKGGRKEERVCPPFNVKGEGEKGGGGEEAVTGVPFFSCMVLGKKGENGKKSFSNLLRKWGGKKRKKCGSEGGQSRFYFLALSKKKKGEH